MVFSVGSLHKVSTLAWITARSSKAFLKKKFNRALERLPGIMINKGLKRVKKYKVFDTL